MHDYAMLSDGDRVLVAVSGGVDSMVLAWLLRIWQEKAPISYSLHAVNIDNGLRGADPSAESIGEQLGRFGIEFSTEKGRDADEEMQTCFACARRRRNRLFELAREKGYTKIAFGHHKDDLVETFFLNLLYSGNISTMVPRQDLFHGRLALIRPLAYLEKSEVRRLAESLGIRAIDNRCPLAGDTRRETVRNMLAGIFRDVPDAKNSIFAAMANVRKGYML
jgi:tRNA 2-thiocytidine biosynthesis protein TtcA